MTQRDREDERDRPILNIGYFAQMLNEGSGAMRSQFPMVVTAQPASSSSAGLAVLVLFVGIAFDSLNKTAESAATAVIHKHAYVDVLLRGGLT
ncbi:hypothetical protein DMJ13_21510 [halophilic archaeon]|nr:hypothetical protein DMJ13_21510 [halophilic archaeon]